MVEGDGMVHLTDEEVDAYWRGTLSTTAEARVEQHYLACADCRERVRLVETLIDALRAEPVPITRTPANARVWQAVAAVMAAAVVATSWGWASSVREARQRSVSGETLPFAAPRRGDTALSTLVGPLSPPTRDGTAATVTLAADTPVVVFEIDAREAGPPGSRFDVSLAGPTGDVVLRLHDVLSTDAGTVLVPVARSVLGPGQFLFEVAAGSSTVALPLVIHSTASR